MKKCLICSHKEYRLIKQIGKAMIYECIRCRLAYTTGYAESRSLLHGENGLYSFQEYEKNENKHVRKFKKIIRIVKQILPKGHILDVGAGHGLFTHLLSMENHYQIDVVEPSLKLQYLQESDIEIYKTTYENFLRTNRKKYDLVTFLDVLEHFGNPKSVLQKTKKILNKNGFLLLLLPNYKSIMAKLSRNWAWWMVEDHKFHFSSFSLRKLLLQRGFAIKYMATFESFSDFKKNLDANYVDIKNQTIKKSLKLLTMVPFLFLYFLFRPILWKLKLGGLLVVVGKSC